jgi:hypothetical protein
LHRIAQFKGQGISSGTGGQLLDVSAELLLVAAAVLILIGSLGGVTTGIGRGGLVGQVGEIGEVTIGEIGEVSELLVVVIVVEVLVAVGRMVDRRGQNNNVSPSSSFGKKIGVSSSGSLDLRCFDCLDF